MSRGAELGLVLACCVEESGHCLIVDKLQKLAAISQRSSKWSATAQSRAVWLMYETSNCLAWKSEHGEVTAIFM